MKPFHNTLPCALFSRMAGAVLCTVAMTASADPLTEPFRARNLSPPIAIFGMPSWDTGLDAEMPSRLALSWEMASYFRFVNADSEQLIVDGETWRASLIYQRLVAESWTIGAELPMVRQSGGVLDDVIDAWHSTFELPDGRRNSRPEDELQLFYTDGTGPSYFRSQPDNGLGDLQLSAARSFGAHDEWLFKLTLKLPTGDDALLAGSGATDLGASLLRTGTATWRSHAAGWFWGGSLLRIGQPETLPAQAREWVAVGMVGASWQPFPRVGFKAQLDLHTAFYDSRLEELGDAAMQATVGGWWAVDERRTLTVAVIEDLIVRAAPDVTLQVNFAWSL